MGYVRRSHARARHGGVDDIDGGEVLGAFHPAPWANGTRAADEVQLLRIGSREQIDAYMKDERRLALAPIRDRSIATTEIVLSEKVLER